MRPALVMTLLWSAGTAAGCGGAGAARPTVVAAPTADPSSSLPEVTLTLEATCEDGADVASGLAVALSIPLTGRPVFQIDDDVMGFAGTADLISDAVADDRLGPLALTRQVRDHVLELAASRDAVGPVTLRYRARSIPTTADGPRDGLRHDATGITGFGAHFLVLPEASGRFRVRIAWVPSRCPASAPGGGASSFGDDAAVVTVGELAELRGAAYAYGQPQRIAIDDGALHLRAAWFGAPALDIAAATAWAARAFAAERAFFADDDPSVYAMFVRVIEAQADRSNGVAHERSMLSSVGPRTTLGRRLKINIAHEMFHRWLGLRLRLRGPEGANFWFTEGFTVHYASVIAFRAGLLSIEEFTEAIDELAARHFDNPQAGATNEQIQRAFFHDRALQIVPYTRGGLYAAELDAALRRASRGQRSLDDLMHALYRAARALPAGEGLPGDAVRQLVERELGPDGAARYDAVIVRGGDPQPPGDAYGPCFTRQPRAPAGFTWTRVPGMPDARCRAW